MNYLLKLPVIKVSQKIGDFYLASIKSKDLVDITYRDVRRLAEEERDVEKYLGIQRPVSKKRISEIKRYLDGADATFPTAVIIAVEERCAEIEEFAGDGVGILMLKPFQDDDNEDGGSIPVDKIAKVLDGQHRIAAFMDDKDNYNFDFSDKDFELNVAIFVGADLEEQANIFATVNLAQTKVNKNIVYDLTEFSKSRSPQKTSHNIAVALDSEESSPLYKRIKRLGTATPGRTKEPITQATFVESLVPLISVDPILDRNKLLKSNKKLDFEYSDLISAPLRRFFVEERDMDIAEIIYNYFSAVREKWPVAWNQIDKAGNLLPKSNAFKALMKYLKDDVLREMASDRFDVPSKKDFYIFLEKVDITDEDFVVSKFAPGSGGQATFLKILRGQLKRSDLIY